MPRQTYSQFITGYFECETCGVVDRDDLRIQVGYRCPRCGAPGESALCYFTLPVAAICDLIGELYPLPDLDATPFPQVAPPIRDSHQLALLVFFCTLGEVLLQHFLERCMNGMAIPADIQTRLLADSLYPKQRIERLFPILAGAKWSDAVAAAGAHDGADFTPTVAFYIDATEKRNELLHRANVWVVPQNMARQCFEQTVPLLRLFVALHNTYLIKPVQA